MLLPCVGMLVSDVGISTRKVAIIINVGDDGDQSRSTRQSGGAPGLYAECGDT